MYMLFILLVHFSIGSPTETGEITGTVLDNRNNESFPGVVVELYQDKDLVGSTFTDFNGEFAFPNTPTGTYHLIFKFVGKRKKRINDISVLSGQTLELDVIYPRKR